jgi:hypothetical protein
MGESAERIVDFGLRTSDLGSGDWDLAVESGWIRSNQGSSVLRFPRSVLCVRRG